MRTAASSKRWRRGSRTAARSARIGLRHRESGSACKAASSARARDGRTAAPRRRARQPLGARSAPRRARARRPSPVPANDASAADELARSRRAPTRSQLAGRTVRGRVVARPRTHVAARARSNRLRPVALHGRPRRALRVRERVQSAAGARHRRGTAEPRRHPGAAEHQMDEARRDVPRRHLSRRPGHRARDRRRRAWR